MRAILTVAIAGAVACAAPPLASARPSAESLAAAVLDALAWRDGDRLRALALDEQEFRVHVWPSLPAARPERNLPFGYVWGDLRQKSDSFLAATLRQHGGRRYTLKSLAFERTTDYAGFRVHRGVVFRIHDAAGIERDVRLCGSFVQTEGRWKVFSYVAED